MLLIALSACRKSPTVLPQSVFVKLFPEDSSYQAGGCFQLSNGNFVLYGFDPDNGGLLPLIIITDPRGKEMHRTKLTSQFHYLTIKPVGNRNKMLAVGVDNINSANENVCVIDSSGNMQSIWVYDVDSVKVGQGSLPDFVEDDAGNFIISGYGKDTTINNQKRLMPFILRIDSNGNKMDLTKYANTTVNRICMAVCNNNNGFSLCGYANSTAFPYKGMFYTQVDKQCNLVWDTLFFDSTQAITAQLIDHQNDDFTIIYGAAKSATLNGTLFTRMAGENKTLGKETFYSDYENLAKPASISKTTDGGYILSATTNILEGGILIFYSKFYLLKLDANLNVQWTRQFNSTNPYTMVSAVQTLDGGYLLGGFEHTASYVFTMVMIKTDADGNIVAE